MRLLRIVPCISLLVMILISNATVVHAQTTSISNLIYPNTVTLNKGTGLVSFTVSYSTPNYGTYYLVAAVFDKTTNDFAHGKLVNANPKTCKTPDSYSWAAACTMTAAKGSGSLDVQFDVTLSIPGYADLDAATAIVDSGGNVPTDSMTEDPFSINVKDTVTLSLAVPNGVAMSVDGAPQGSTTVVSLDLRLGSHLIVVPSLVSLKPGSRLKFDRWSDGSIEATRTIDLESDTRLQAIYVTQYNLTLVSSEANPNGAGWYDSGSSASFSVPSTYPMSGILGDLGGKWVFNGWYEEKNLSFSSPNDFLTMDTSHKLTASWAGDYTEPGLILGIPIVALLAVVFWMIHARRGKGSGSKRKRRRSKPKEEIEMSDVEKQDVVSSETTEP